MNDWFFRQGGRHRFINLLGFDAWFDSTLAAIWDGIKDFYSALSSFFARFRLTGWKRLLNEGVSECLTLGAGGLVVTYMLALPAFQEIEDGRWLKTGTYSVKFLDVDGNEIGKRGINLNDAVPLEEIPDHLIKATLATEDRRFYDHFGIDFLGTLRALAENIRAGETVQGGSTITQQLAKNLFLSSERSLSRKIKEMFLAFWLETRLTKREILKLYLDRAYMGGGAFGVEAASQFYFGKSVREITLAEAAVLAGLYKAPTKYAPHINLPASRARTNEVLSNMVEAGYYTEGQVHSARLYPANIVENRQTSSPDWFLDWAFEEVQRIMADKGQYTLTARTTIDLNLQKHADEILAATVRQKGRQYNFDSGAVTVLEPDGKVVAMAGGPDYGESQFNRSTHARRQPGSSFKIYVYATALENGFKPNTTVSDSSRSCGNWHPQNYGGSHGSGSRMPLWMALARSLNTVAAELSFRVGREKVIEMTRRLGIKGIKRSCSMALGDYGITPLEHTSAVATFANGGKRATPYGILDIVNSRGEMVYSHDRDEPPAPQIVSREVAEEMIWMMNKVVTDGTAKRADLDFTHVAGKTGTSTGPKDVWFMGMTGRYVASVWLGNDDNRNMTNGATGGGVAAPVWHALMVAAGTEHIPTLPGLPPHPYQVAEAQRLASEGKRLQSDDERRQQSIMPAATKAALKKLAEAMRKASDTGASPLPAPLGQPGSQTPERRAEAPRSTLSPMQALRTAR
ncbi:MAG: transglycosylase domain-containing protein [Hyphomicrobiaceae bacterium]